MISHLSFNCKNSPRDTYLIIKSTNLGSNINNVYFLLLYFLPYAKDVGSLLTISFSERNLKNRSCQPLNCVPLNMKSKIGFRVYSQSYWRAALHDEQLPRTKASLSIHKVFSHNVGLFTRILVISFSIFICRIYYLYWPTRGYFLPLRTTFSLSSDHYPRHEDVFLLPHQNNDTRMEGNLPIWKK